MIFARFAARNGSHKHGAWTNEAVAIRRRPRRCSKQSRARRWGQSKYVSYRKDLQRKRCDLPSFRPRRFAMKTDSQLQRDVLEELKWEPGIDHEKIGVAVDKGVVTLSGIVGSYAEKLLAENAARSVKGVRGIAEDIVVRYADQKKSSDSEIAKRVLDVLEWDSLIPSDKINVTVEDGVVRLRGDVNWHFQKDFAYKAASKITGVTRVDNRITVTPSVSPMVVKTRIEDAFDRQADLEAENIGVRTEGRKVILEGTVSSLNRRGIAERAAWAAPGVSDVEDKLVIV
jgi:osmotically-inducible protein OsmY